ncbi:MAG: FeoA family protein [Alphaproteobacteria bacterium]
MATLSENTVCLADLRPGARGRIAAILLDAARAEVANRLREMGFIEDARIVVLHESPFGHDPIAVKIDDVRVALRRVEAASILVSLDED